MSSNVNGTEIVVSTNADSHIESSVKWWEKLVDVEEAKRQLCFCLPIILTTVAYYGIPLVSVMFAGHLGELELAAGTLAQSWATVTGQSLMVGLSGAMDTLCGQGFGAKEYGKMGIYLQANCIISTCFAMIVSVIWVFSDKILILLHQEPRIAIKAGIYLKHLIPVLFGFGIQYNLLSYLQTQSIVIPLVVCSFIPLILHIGIAYVLTRLTSLGFRGAPIATSISVYISVAMISTYVLRSKRFKLTWEGFTFESFRYVSGNLRLALPSACMVCLEYWAFEILVLLAGIMPNSEISTPLVAMCVNTETIAYMVAYGLSAAASTRVSNELGRGNSGQAKNAMFVTLKIGLVMALIVDLALGFGHNIWAGLFSNSEVIRKKFASMTPFLLISVVLDYLQGVLSGVSRGCGWQKAVVIINLAAFYLVGMTVAGLLGFKAKLYERGLWIGLICGLIFQLSGLFSLTLLTKWDNIQLSARKNGGNKEMTTVKV